MELKQEDGGIVGINENRDWSAVVCVQDQLPGAGHLGKVLEMAIELETRDGENWRLQKSHSRLLMHSNWQCKQQGCQKAMGDCSCTVTGNC